MIGDDFEQFSQDVLDITSNSDSFQNNPAMEEIKEENLDDDENESSNAFRSGQVKTYSTFFAPTEKISGSSKSDDVPDVRFLVNFTDIRPGAFLHFH